jgi:hypothetical protein
MSINSCHQINLEKLFLELSQVFDGDTEIEKIASQELLQKAKVALVVTEEKAISEDIANVMRSDDAHPICSEILKTPFNWTPPETSKSDLYKKHSHFKAHVELLGPDGLVKSNIVRLGLYGMQSHSEYGYRTHPAEEIYVMLAGECFWRRGNSGYQSSYVGGRSHHPSFLPHATLTKELAFMSVYAWTGDLSTQDYKYEGLPELC